MLRHLAVFQESSAPWIDVAFFVELMTFETDVDGQFPEGLQGGGVNGCGHHW